MRLGRRNSMWVCPPSAVCVLFVVAAASALHADNGKPEDAAFPIGLYCVESRADLEQVARDGFTFVLPYRFASTPVGDGKLLTADEYMQATRDLGMQVVFPLGPIGSVDESLPAARAETIRRYAAYSNILWWYLLPEERRFWYEDEFNSLQEQSQLVRKNDSQQRPRFMYIPTNYAASDIEPYVPHLDIIGAGGYTNYALKPRVWIRWRMEQQTTAIERAGGRGTIPIAVLQMFPPESRDEVPTTGAHAYHDGYLSLICGARALLIHTFNPAYRDRIDPGIYQAYSRIAQELNGRQPLGAALLSGNLLADVNCQVVAGPKYCETFSDSFTDQPGSEVKYSSVHCRAVQHEGQIFILATNSAAEPVTVEFQSLPQNVGPTVSLPFESRQLRCEDNCFRDELQAASAHVYVLTASDQSSRQRIPVQSR